MSRRVSRFFWTHVDGIDPDHCWEWTAARTNSGYGQSGGGLAHRVSYEVFSGPIPPGFQIDHLCQNRLCVNPRHLEAVTARENQRRAAKYRPRGLTKSMSVAYPPVMGPQGPGKPRQDQLRELLDAGFSCYRAAQVMGVSKQATSRLLKKLRARGYVYPKEETT